MSQPRVKAAKHRPSGNIVQNVVRKLGQQAREENRHLRVAEVAEHPLAKGSSRAASRRRSQLRGLRQTYGRDERLQPEEDEVRRTREAQRREGRLRGEQQRREPSARRDCPHELAADHPERGEDSPAPTSGERVANRQRRVLPWSDDDQERHAEKRRDLAGVHYSTVTVFARLRGWSTFRPRRRAIRYASSCSGTTASTACRKAGVRGT